MQHLPDESFKHAESKANKSFKALNYSDYRRSSANEMSLMSSKSYNGDDDYEVLKRMLFKNKLSFYIKEFKHSVVGKRCCSQLV